jgi:hypothetical protein
VRSIVTRRMVSGWEGAGSRARTGRSLAVGSYRYSAVRPQGMVWIGAPPSSLTT